LSQTGRGRDTYGWECEVTNIVGACVILIDSFLKYSILTWFP